jgi:hypothetical protein
MRYYLRFGEGGLYFVDCELSIEEFTKKIRAGEEIHPLYSVLGKQRRYPKGLSENADIYPYHPIIPFNNSGTKYGNEQRGFITLAFEYDKAEMIKLIREIDPTILLETDHDLEMHLTRNGYSILRKLNCTVLREEWYGKCIVDSNAGMIIFLSNYCMLIQGSQPMVGFENCIYKLKDNAPYRISYIPCIPEDMVYNIYLNMENK